LRADLDKTNQEDIAGTNGFELADEADLGAWGEIQLGLLKEAGIS